MSLKSAISAKLQKLFKPETSNVQSWPEDELSPSEQLLRTAQFQSDYDLASDQQAAFDACKEAANRGVVEAIYILGVMYEKGDGTNSYCKEAAECYYRAARQDKPEAQYNLALLHANDSLGQTNYPVALEYFKAAADNGIAQAQYNVACMYDQGLGCFEDKAQALEYFLQAAQQGMQQAWNNIAVIYYEGQGVEKDLVKAYGWTLLAAKAGVPEAQQSEPVMTQELTQEQVQAGKVFLDELLENYGRFLQQ